ncbi:hypothetical protein AKJ47_01225 [candidate division MSBL1 archaeon SCGC-AAA261G05]|uniref:Orc1-like AAA ATPase domain-containing protein n=2 Tax=candidate division MSBL1 TaxID=215777 RepID=A0A133VC25_9EURY|nr:hypothetical protein AKJ47_01225 [candidate division MSBL1 archaeon SCGC-AAA261G05]KXB04852.1 hypothetical protein AKJ48_01220 [candidate division MSBL1 archaeon SCGC-AAA261O19]
MKTRTVFKDKNKLSPKYIPRKLVDREEEFRELVRLFHHVLEEGGSQRVIVCGSLGSGRTILTNVFAHEMRKFGKKRGIDILPVYADCRKDRTPREVLGRLQRTCDLEKPIRGVSYASILERVVKQMKSRDAYLEAKARNREVEE